MGNTIKFRRGLSGNLPTLGDGEPGWCTNTKQLYIGQNGINYIAGEGTFLKLTGGSLSNFLTLHANPTSPLHAATKKYVDNIASGLSVKASVRCISVANIPGTFFENQITVTATGVVTVDGIPLDIEKMRVLISGQSNFVHNGIYIVRVVGSEGVNCVLERAEDFDDGTVLSGTFVFVEDGTSYGKTGWVLTGEAPIIINTSLITFVQFSGSGASSFISLTDCPSKYEGSEGNVVLVNDDATGLIFKPASEIGRTTFLSLDDTPSSYVSGKILVSGAASVQFANAKIFAGLFTDVPASLGTTNQLLSVKSNGTGVEFISCSQISREEGIEPVATGWAYKHEKTETGIHGAPAGKHLLNENSVIDGGSF